MKRIPMLAAALISALAIAGGTILTLTPRDASGLTWRYYTISDGTRADRQVDAILYRYPSRYTVWPQRRIATSYSYGYSNEGGLPCVKNAEPYTWRAVCRGWQATGPVGEYKISMGVEVNWKGAGFKDEGWFGIEYRTYCNPVQAIAVTLNPISCGLISQSNQTVTLGFYFSTTTQSFGFYPQTTVWWRSYITCTKYEGNCYEPFTVPAG